jgi:myo-inositol 2-dehydrogenase/D-chiro-inositol 1-dehydrogenase
MAVRVGFIGAGGMNSSHMRNLAQIEGAQIVAICDLQEERAKQRAEEYGAEAYTCWKKMLKDAKMDALYVAVPPFAHEGQEQAAAELGIHLFVEKPVAVNIETAQSVLSAIKKAGVIATAGFQDRYQDTVALMKGLLAKNKPAMVMGYWIGGMPGVPWWRVKAQSGGQAVEQTIHTFDMARYLLGEVKSVQCTWSTGLMTDVPNYDVEDATCVNLQFESGVCGTIFSGCFLKGLPGKVGLDIWCQSMRIEYAGRKQVTVLEPEKEPVVTQVGNTPGLDFDATFMKAVAAADKDAKAAQAMLKSSYADACRSLAVPLAANESIATGAIVEPVKFED